MFCIAAFIIFVVLGIFSVRYRSLAKKAWYCVGRKLTLRPCEIGFKEEAKDALIGRFILTRPRLARFLDRWIEVFATIFVVLSVWSLLLVLQSGLFLFVYDTCNPKDVESCSLGGESCGVSTGQQSFLAAVMNFEVLDWTKEETLLMVDTFARIPDRFKRWEPEMFIDSSATYYKPFDSKKQTALEVIDPGCKFCAKLFRNMKVAEFEDVYNVTYIPYAIPDPTTPSGYKFPNSTLVIAYLESVKQYPLQQEIPADWQILERLFVGEDQTGASYQEQFNFLYSAKEAETVLLLWLEDMGYDEIQIEKIQETAQSEEIQNIITKQNEIVEDQIRTIKIPTIMFDGRRYDRVIGEEKLK
tara:strand:+ start:2159 stop:3229 length:1071 start_codon:yes stop_codon:yes gene_type:complete